MRALIVGLVALGLVAAGAPREDKKDQDLIQGTWKLVEGERNGEKPPPEFLENFKVTFKGDKAIPEGRGNDSPATFKLDTNAKPRRIEIKPTDSDRVMRGIYELNGDSMKICFGGPGSDAYPTEFSGKAGSNTMLMIFKRQK